MADEKKGVLAQHRDRMANDPEYRAAALSINPDGAGGAALGKSLPSTEPTKMAARKRDAD